jgi:hypothetical protein
MKKLVVTAALLVAAVSSYARPESFDVYNIRITLKTTKANAGIEDINYRTVTTKKYRAMYILSTGDRFDVSYNTILLGFDGVLFEDTISWNNVVRIGKNNTEIEADGYVEGNDASIYMQGFGRYDQMNNRVSSLNGSVIAYLPPPMVDGDYVFGYDLSEPGSVEEGSTIGVGSFSLLYSPLASSKLLVGGEVADAYISAFLRVELMQNPE